MLKFIFAIMCNYMPCEHAEIVTKQAVLETGWFKSDAFINKCNPFGLSYAGEILEFESIEQACEAYHKQIYTRYSSGNYYTFLKDMRYAEDPDYVWKLKHISLNL